MDKMAKIDKIDAIDKIDKIDTIDKIDKTYMININRQIDRQKEIKKDKKDIKK